MAKNESVTYIKQSIETELRAMVGRLDQSVGNCNRIKKDVPSAVKWKKILLELEQEIHDEWKVVATNK